MNNKIVIKNREPQQITINGGGEVIGITTVLVNGIDVTEGSVAYVIVPTKTSELINDSGFITQETDPTIPYYIKQISQADINRWNNKQEQLVSGVNIKTINENSLLGSGNIDISTTYTAGYGININASNEISNTITSYNDLTDLPTIPTSTSELINDSDYVTSNELSDVAFSGSYADLSNIPEIPDSTSELINDSGFIDMNLLWNLFPKSTGSGASINLTDTVKNTPLYLTLGATALTQAGTPTPSSPQDIHTITGNNTIQIKDNNDIVQEEAEIDLGDLEYCKIGNYEDKFIRSNDGTWQLEKNIGKVVLDGSETIGTEGTVAGKTRFRIGGISNVYKNSSSSDASTIKCDKLISGSVVDTYNDIQCISFGLSSSDYYKDFVVYITDTGTMSTADFITWLGTNNLTVYYRLATPTYTQITGTLAEQLETIYKDLTPESEQTNISQTNADLPFTITATTLKSLANI